jgi:MoaA/NifB/PqqE/SkfB family radical SAM enzyme
MTIYKLLKINSLVKNFRIKFLGLWMLNVLNKRTIAIFLDPVLACNLRCKMCYFSDETKRASLKGKFSADDLELFAKSLFSNALKLQIGCGAEPTLYPNVEKIIILGKQYAVPFISLCTNANLLTQEKINAYLAAGLDELIISLHGITRSTYEKFMVNANYDTFVENIKLISQARKQYPNFKLRVNYTFNQDNFDEIKYIFSLFNNVKIDYLQLRPINNLGESEYKNYDLSPIKNKYIDLIEQIKSEAQLQGTTLLYNKSLTTENLDITNTSDFLLPYTYLYASPKACWYDSFDFRKETFQQWSKRTSWKIEI